MTSFYDIAQIGVLGFFTLMPAHRACGQEPASELRDEAILPTAIDAILGNYAQLTSIRARLYCVFLDPKVEQTQVKTIETPGGGRFTFTETPRSATRMYFTSKGPDYRCERQSGTIFICKDDELTQFVVGSKRTQTRPLAESGSMITLDPRAFGGLDQRYGLVDQLKRSRLISAEFHQGGTVEIETEIVNAEKNPQPGARHRYTLDRERNWLPTRVVALRSDGLIATVTDFEYDEALTHVWFMKQVTTHYAGNYQIAEITPEVIWSQTHLTYTFGKPEFNVPVSDEELTSLRPRME